MKASPARNRSLDRLDELLELALQRLGHLERDNQQLRERLRELEERLEQEARSGGDWREEREEVRKRLSRWVERLEGLLGESPES